MCSVVVSEYRSDRVRRLGTAEPVNRSHSSMKRWRLPDLTSQDKGFGDGLSAAFELVVTPAIFGFLGFLLDRLLGTVPLFTLVFSVSS